MEAFEIHILGCGCAKPTVRHNPSAQVVNVRGKLFLIDCGEGTQLQMRKMHLNLVGIHAVFISHLHGDHCFGLPGLIATLSLLKRTEALHIYANKALQEIMQPFLSFFCRSLSFEVVYHPISHTDAAVIYEDRSLSVRTIPLHHSVPSCGFLFNEKPNLPHIRRDMIDFLNIPHYAIRAIKEGEDWTDSDGKVWPHEKLVTPATPSRAYAYMSDTGFVPQVAPLIHGVDLLYHEATYIERDADSASKYLHSTASQAAETARLAEVKRLLLGHFSSRYEDENVILGEATPIFPDAEMADEGMVIRL